MNKASNYFGHEVVVVMAYCSYRNCDWEQETDSEYDAKETHKQHFEEEHVSHDAQCQFCGKEFECEPAETHCWGEDQFHACSEHLGVCPYLCPDCGHGCIHLHSSGGAKHCCPDTHFFSDGETVSYE